ncbi:ion channel [Halopelagius longus]|uniref:Two pore domain potassium channel family protein n=1 Tax=Halopelagius longus TaxID=1236180 RepID=A0A1H1DP21_9EURY|nr:ion channel [Halopelagius longus]RDI71402.1 two pore domain potassium channel family protein [Halopelagius longus]SDQ77968.1 hypothetical protein SAMN05216278_2497 [Halopelagius longus]
MNPASLALGGLLLVGTVVDILWTTLWAEGGAGPFTSKMMRWTWSALERGSGGRSRVLTLAGPVILTLTLAFWLLFIWLGWALLFAGGADAIYNTSTGRAVSLADTIYFAGYTVFTLGNGGFSPREGVWQMATVLATASGMLFVTLSATYLLSVLSAVTQKHAFAGGVTGLGTDADTVVRAFWDGDGFRGLDHQLDTFSAQVNTLTANHKAYPILHYFHSEQRENDPIAAVVVLDETLTLLRFGLAERNRLSEALLDGTRSSVGDYLDTLSALSTSAQSVDSDPPPPDLDSLRERGLPTVSDERFADALDDDLNERRRTLLAFVESGGREWPSAEEE